MRPDSIDEIVKRLNETDPLRVMFAIKYCVLNNIIDNSVIETLKALKNSELVEWNTCHISHCAYAALDLLKIQTYTGNNETIKEYIDTRFYETIKVS